MTRKASIKETGEELSQAEWERFDAAVAAEKAERPREEGPDGEAAVMPVSSAVDGSAKRKT